MWSHEKHKINFQRQIFVKFSEKDTHKWYLTNEVKYFFLKYCKGNFKEIILNEISCKSWFPVANSVFRKIPSFQLRTKILTANHIAIRPCFSMMAYRSKSIKEPFE